MDIEEEYHGNGDKTGHAGKRNKITVVIVNIFLSPARHPFQAFLGWCALITFIWAPVSYFIIPTDKQLETAKQYPKITITQSHILGVNRIIDVGTEDNEDRSLSIWACGKSGLTTPLVLNSTTNATIRIQIPVEGPTVKILLNFSDDQTAFLVFDNYSNSIIGSPKYLEGEHSCDSAV